MDQLQEKGGFEMINLDDINSKKWMDLEDKKKHFEVICNFLEYLNRNSNDYFLKGGTSLMLCYGLDRFSEDIDLDSTNKSISGIVNKFCAINGFEYRVAKDTDTVKRFLIHYGTNKPLKIEISYRQKSIDKNRVCLKNGVYVYKINEIFGMKMNAYNSRDKIRDLYDVVFIVNHYYDQLSEERLEMFKDVLSYKGLEQFDYLINTQQDELIDKDKLGNDFLEMFDKLGVLYDKENQFNKTPLTDLSEMFQETIKYLYNYKEKELDLTMDDIHSLVKVGIYNDNPNYMKDFMDECEQFGIKKEWDEETNQYIFHLHKDLLNQFDLNGLEQQEDEVEIEVDPIFNDKGISI